MNARSYRVSGNYSELDFHVEAGLVESSVNYYSDAKIINNKVELSITKAYITTDSTNKNHQVLAVQSVYEIPPSEIKSRDDVYEFYKDALLGLNEVYQAYRSEMAELPHRDFAAPPIESYQGEIDRVFNLLNSRN